MNDLIDREGRIRYLMGALEKEITEALLDRKVDMSYDYRFYLPASAVTDDQWIEGAFAWRPVKMRATRVENEPRLRVVK